MSTITWVLRWLVRMVMVVARTYQRGDPFPTQARDGTLAVEDMDGGTFTISNGGVFGSLYGTPIINPPQSAILGMHGVFDRPVAINKQVDNSSSIPQTGWEGGPHYFCLD